MGCTVRRTTPPGRRCRRPAGSGGIAAANPEIFRVDHFAALTQRGDAFGVHTKADIGDPGHRGDHRPALFKALRTVQVGDTLFGQDVGDVITINHYRRQRHAEVFATSTASSVSTKVGFTPAEGFDHLHHQLFPALHRVRLGDHIEPCRGGVAATVRVVAHVRRRRSRKDGRG